MTLVERIDRISEKMENAPLSQAVQELMSISLELKDYDEYGVLYYLNTPINKDSNLDIKKT